ncbi:MAG: YybH family protein [Woeseiaceae bacterium]
MKAKMSVFFALLMTGCMQAPEADLDGLAAMQDVWQSAFEAGDSAAIAAIYSADGAVLPPNGETVTGRAAIDAFWNEFLASGINGEIKDTEVYAQGDLGYKVGTYTMTDATGAAIDDGKYVEIWRRVDDQWQLHRDIFNSNRPLSAGEAQTSRVVLTAEVEDSAKWEQGFRTHGDLLGTMSASISYYAATDDNEIAVYSEPVDLDKFMEVLESPETAEAMEMDGIKRDTVKVFVLDKEFDY